MIYIDLDTIKQNPRARAELTHVSIGKCITASLICIPYEVTLVDFIIKSIERDNCGNYVFEIETNDEKICDILKNNSKICKNVHVEHLTKTIRHEPLPEYLFKYRKHRPCPDYLDYDPREFETIEHALKRLKKRNKK